MVAVLLLVLQMAIGLDYQDFWPRTTLGILGLFFMLIMHIYSIRKKQRSWKFLIGANSPLSSFLNWHIVTGTVGVTFICFHAFGSYDSIIAWVSFLSMAIVWQSGFIGRYIFVRIPKDQTGFIEEHRAITEHLENQNKEFIDSMTKNHESESFQKTLIGYLTNYGKSLHALHKKTDESILRFFTNFGQIWNAWKHFKKSLFNLEHGSLDAKKQMSPEDAKDFEKHLAQYKSSMKSILLLHFQMEFNNVLKALFKNWHDIHIPLTYLLYTTAVLHIIVVSIFATFAK